MISISRHRKKGATMRTSSATATPGNRVSVSLRLPEDIVATITKYATKNALRKTDAYLHFLRLGIAEQNAGSDRKAMRHLTQQVDEILGILKAGAPTELDRESVLAAITSVAGRYPAINQAYLFGSFATGTHTPESDVDVQLVLDRKKRFNLRDLSRFTKDLEQATGRDCDIVTTNTIKDADFARRIEAERIIAYERPQQ